MADEFQADLSDYLRQTLHTPVTVEPLEQYGRLPVFLTRTYDLLDVRLKGKRCVLLVPRKRAFITPSQIAKHVALVRSTLNTIVVFAAKSLAPHNRSRLISHGVGFVVPRNQLYIPELAMDLREHFRPNQIPHADGLTPAAQALVFDHLLRGRGGADAVTPSAVAERLHYTKMSIGRAFHELTSLKLTAIERHGKETRLKFNSTGHALLDLSRELLRSPVRAVKHIRELPKSADLKRSGETALAELTDLSRPPVDTYAISATQWRSTADSLNLIEVPTGESDVIVETWSYDPSVLSDAATVDPLSLYAQFWNDPDERVSKAAGELIKRVTW